jgi:hypothetical protein
MSKNILKLRSNRVIIKSTKAKPDISIPKIIVGTYQSNYDILKLDSIIKQKLDIKSSSQNIEKMEEKYKEIEKELNTQSYLNTKKQVIRSILGNPADIRMSI